MLQFGSSSPARHNHCRELAEAQGAGRFFSVWENLAKTELAEVKTEKGEEGFTVFTVSDKTWLENIPQGNGNNNINLLDLTKSL